jgi:hypothetical protein
MSIPVTYQNAPLIARGYSKLISHRPDTGAYDPFMPKLTHEIRLENARTLVAEAGGTAAFARRMDMSISQAGQVVGKAPRRNIGAALSRKMEEVFRRPKGWMDTDHGVVLPMNGSHKGYPPSIIEIPRFDVNGSMGSGHLRPDRDVIVGGLPLNRNWAAANLGGVTALSNLAVITGMGDSMEPTFRDGDLLLVDRGVNDIRVDTVYVLALNDELYIKRIQRDPISGGMRMLSDNKLNEPVEIKRSDLPKFQVLGRVVWAWCGKKL